MDMFWIYLGSPALTTTFLDTSLSLRLNLPDALHLGLAPSRAIRALGSQQRLSTRFTNNRVFCCGLGERGIHARKLRECLDSRLNHISYRTAKQKGAIAHGVPFQNRHDEDESRKRRR